MEQRLIPKIRIKHSRIEINNYDLSDAPELEYMFSVWDPIYHASFPKAIEYDKENKKLILPRGMDINYLTRTFMYEPYVDRTPDPYTTTDPLPIKYLTKDERQLNILKFILGVDEYSYTKSKSQISVNSSTGSGKTFVTVASICFTGARAIIITSSVEWLAQWKDRILEYTNLKDNDVYMIVGKPSLDKILARNPLDHQIFLASHSTIKAYGDREGWDKVEGLFKHLRCSLKVFDEAHLYFDNMAKIDFHSNTKKTLYLTATPERSNREEDVVYQEYFRNIPSIELFDEESDPHVNYIGLLFYSNPSPYDVGRYSTGKFNFDRNIYTNYLVDSPNFLKLVSVIVDMTLRIPGKVLIYIGVNEAILKVYNYIMTEFPFLNGAVSIYTSITAKEDKEAAKRAKFILSTTKSCGAASDIADLTVTVVLAEPFKSSVTARQTLGRCRADNTLYIDCVDMSCYRTKKYYNSKKQVFSRYAKSCREVLMDDATLEAKYEEVANIYQTKKVLTIPVFKK